MSPSESTESLPNRLVHLDFHTSPDIPLVGSAFEAEAFAEKIGDAGIQSLTLFAKCHHGLCYYPTKAGLQHPGLKGRDLMGEQIEALHRRGIRCPIYLTVGFEEVAAHQHPDWRQLDREGHSIRAKPTMGGEGIPGGWYFMNWLHPDYQALIEQQVLELLSNYTVDGFFFDILVFDPEGGWSPEARAFRRKHVLQAPGQTAFDHFLGAAQNAFSTRFSDLVRARRPKASLFYNCGAVLTTDSRLGIRNREAAQTHYELESLPGGHWGYHHFPRIGRFVPQLDMPWIGQTGRFQKSWGDYGGLKPDPALEYECFRSQALGGRVAVGDQLYPDGRFDEEALSLIGRVFALVKAAEPFYSGATPSFDTGIFATGAPGCDWQGVQRSESGALLLSQAARRNPVLLDDRSAFEHLSVVILPDAVVVTDRLAERLRHYHQTGGCLILSHRAGFDATGRWRLDFLPFQPTGSCAFKPTYWRTSPSLSQRWSRTDRVIYSEGMTLEAGPGCKVLIKRVLPLFQRTDAQFCGHFQAPPREEAEASPALIAGEGFLYFADPIFRDFRQSSQVYLSEIWTAAVEHLLGAPFVKTALPPSIEVIPARRGDDLLLTLLRYLPVRKALEIDIIDERLPFDGEELHFPCPPDQLLPFPGQEPLPRSSSGGFVLHGKGRLLLTAPGFFTETAGGPSTRFPIPASGPGSSGS